MTIVKYILDNREVIVKSEQMNTSETSKHENLKIGSCSIAMVKVSISKNMLNNTIIIETFWNYNLRKIYILGEKKYKF